MSMEKWIATGQMVESAFSRYPMYTMLEVAERRMFTSIISSLVCGAQDVHPEGFTMSGVALLAQLDQPLGRVANMKASLHGFTVPEGMINATVDTVFGDCVEMITRGVRTIEELQLERKLRP